MFYPLTLDSKLNDLRDEVTFQHVADLIADSYHSLTAAQTLSQGQKLNDLKDEVTVRRLGELVKALDDGDVLPSKYLPGATERVNLTPDVVSLAHVVKTMVASAAPKAKPPINLWAAGSTTTGLTANSAAQLAIKAAPALHPSGRTTALAVKVLNGDNFVSVRIPAAQIPANFKLDDAYSVGMWVYWPGASGSVVLRFSTSNFGTDRKEFPWAWSGQLHTGWNLVTVNPKGAAGVNPGGIAWTVNGAYTDATVINGIEVILNTAGTADVEIFIDSIFYTTGRQQRGTVVLGFDAFGESSIVNLAMPLLNARDIKAYWSGDANLVDTPTNARALAQTWYDNGHDLVTQGYNHVDYTQNVGLLANDYLNAQGVHRGLGWNRGLGMFMYPLSSNNEATDAILAAEGVKVARSGWAWQIHENEYNAGPKLLGHGAVNIGGKTLAQVRDIVAQARYLGNTVFLFTHGLVAGGNGGAAPADPTYWYVNDYTTLLDELVADRSTGNLNIESATEWVFRRKRMI